MHEATPAVCDADHTSRGSALPWYGRLTQTLHGADYVPLGTPVRVNDRIGSLVGITRNLTLRDRVTFTVPASWIDRDDSLAPRAQA